MVRTPRQSPNSEAPRRRVGERRPAIARVAPKALAAPATMRRGEAPLAVRLGQEIVSGVYPPGSLLPSSAEMGERYSASRTALREAYSKLSGKGLIVARPKIGTRVRPRTDWNLLDPEVLAWHLSDEPDERMVTDLFELRRAIEPLAAEIVAAGRSEANVERIAEAYDRMERFKNGGGDLIGADLDFHLAILDATGNHFLRALGGLIQASMEWSFRLSWLGAAAIRDDRLLQHRSVLDAIRASTPEQARLRMVELLTDSIDDIRKYCRRRDRAVARAKGRRQAL
jgi:GntR family galactonate operon transcriptional repressor